VANDPASLRPLIDEAVARGDAATARTHLQALWDSAPGPATAGYVLSRFERLGAACPLAPLRVLVLRSFTVEPLVPLLRAAGAVQGFDLQVRLGEFNAYAQEILDPAGAAFADDPQLVFLAVQARDVAPELWRDFADLSPADVERAVERVAGGFAGWLRALRERSGATVVVHDLEVPAWPSQGILDAQSPASQVGAIRAVNARLRETARALRGVHVLDWDGLLARLGRLASHDERRRLTVRMPLSPDALAPVVDEWLRYVVAASGRGSKCLVCDLDNTLWGGIVGEDGVEGIRLGPEYPGAAYVELQRAILDLYQRGVLLAVCSKNNRDDALQALAGHPHMLLRPAHFAAMRIDWTEKVEGLRAIAAELNIGLDSLVLADDNPVECEDVRQRLPEVRVLHFDGDPTGFADRLRRCPWFERLDLTEEDRERGRLYAGQRQRAELEQATGSLEEFYRSLRMRMVLAAATPATLARAAQLTQKTNQFNLTTRRYTEPQVAAFLADPACRVLTAQVEDRFGDNGIVGLVIARAEGDAWALDTFLLSCRVIGRTVETAVLARVAELAREAGAARLRAEFVATKKNAPARDVYAAHGFRRVAGADEAGTWELDLAGPVPAVPDWIEIAPGPAAR
jgi:FkbH-like protein